MAEFVTLGRSNVRIDELVPLVAVAGVIMVAHHHSPKQLYYSIKS